MAGSSHVLQGHVYTFRACLHGHTCKSVFHSYICPKLTKHISNRTEEAAQFLDSAPFRFCHILCLHVLLIWWMEASSPKGVMSAHLIQLNRNISGDA